MSHDIHFTEARLSEVILHRIGNRHLEEGVLVSKQPLQPSEALRETLQQYFLGSFSLEALYQFAHPSDLMMNETYAYCSYIFENQADMYAQSVHMLTHLYEKSNHAKIQAGEFYLAYFEDCVLNDELVPAIGIFKTETKDKFLRLDMHDAENPALACEEGINLARLDKGCLIFQTAADTGYRVLTIDLKSSESKYWLDDFLGVTQVEDDNLRTKTCLDLCKDFTKKVLAKSDKNEQLAFVNKSLDYFQTKETFDYQEFKNDVFGDAPELADKFDSFQREKPIREKYNFASEEEEQGGTTLADWDFFISPTAVKKAKRSFKNIIQLDTQVEIKIQSAQAQDEGFIERGFDEERQMHYYKVFFNQEK